MSQSTENPTEQNPADQAADVENEAQEASAPVDTKAVFAAALARKNAAAKSRAEHLDGDNHIHGTSRPGVSKRQFRRKSG